MNVYLTKLTFRKWKFIITDKLYFSSH